MNIKLCIFQSIAKFIPGRNHAQCLQRWNKVLKPGLKKGKWSAEEDEQLWELILKACPTWAYISDRITGRSYVIYAHFLEFFF